MTLPGQPALLCLAWLGFDNYKSLVTETVKFTTTLIAFMTWLLLQALWTGYDC